MDAHARGFQNPSSRSCTNSQLWKDNPEATGVPPKQMPQVLFLGEASLPSRSNKVKGSLSQPSSRAAGCTSRCP